MQILKTDTHTYLYMTIYIPAVIEKNRVTHCSVGIKPQDGKRVSLISKAWLLFAWLLSFFCLLEELINPPIHLLQGLIS